MLLDPAFETLDLELVTVKLIEGNDRSKRAVEKSIERFDGRYVGLLRSWLAVEGEVFECHRYTISRSENDGANGRRSEGSRRRIRLPDRRPDPALRSYFGGLFVLDAVPPRCDASLVPRIAVERNGELDGMVAIGPSNEFHFATEPGEFVRS